MDENYQADWIRLKRAQKKNTTRFGTVLEYRTGNLLRRPWGGVVRKGTVESDAEHNGGDGDGLLPEMVASVGVYPIEPRSGAGRRTQNEARPRHYKSKARV